MHVAHVMGALRPSGMEVMLAGSADVWAEHQISLSVIGQGNEHPYAAALIAAGIKVQLVGCAKSVRGFHQLVQALSASNADVVHLHTEKAYLATALAARLGRPGAPAIRTVHSLFAPTGRWALQRAIQSGLGDRLVEALVAPSEDVQQNEARFGRDLQVIPNWVADRFWSARNQRMRAIAAGTRGRPLAVLVGNCASVKRHELALEGLLRSPGLDVVHLGEESNADQSELRILDQLAAQGRLLHRGTADPLPWLVRADLFLFPSAREGMGVALAEALAVGVPSIVSASPGLNWARALPGVLSVDDRVNTWCEAISGHNRDSLLPALPPEFTAVAGVAKYGRLYQGLVSQRGKKLRTETAHAYDCC